MDQTCQVLIDLLKKSLWGTELPDYTTLEEPVDWTAVFTEAKHQSVDLRDKWESYSDKLRVKYHHILAAQDELLDRLSRNDIPAVILKGAAAAVYYPAPSRRSMGDIDFLVPQDLYDKAEDLLKTSGYKMVHDRSENPRHSMFAKGGINFELHHHFSHDGTNIEEYLIDGLHHAVTEEIDGHQFRMLPSLPNGLVLLDHMRSHLASGMGLRQVIDWMMYVDKVVNDDYWNNTLMVVAKEKELNILSVVATKMCIQYLGLPNTITWCNEADDSLCTELLNYIFSSGNFGRKKGDGNKIETVTTFMRREGILRRLQKSGEYNWKAYKKHHWLKPFCWFYQIFRYIRNGVASRRNAAQIKTNINASKERTELLNKLGI